MTVGSTHSGEMSQDSFMSDQHRKDVDPTARAARKGFEFLSASSVGLEMGIATLIGILGGYFADKHFGTSPWLLLLGLAFGLAAAGNGVMRALRQADRAAEKERHGG